MNKPSILRTLLLMILVSIGIFLLIVWGLGVYTRHNTNIPVPEVKGKTFSDATRLLEQTGLYYEVVDSIYDPSVAPGTISEIIPEAGHRVKPGRIVFLKVYAFSERQLVIPVVKNISARQAEALLRGLGFVNISTKVVVGSNSGLCIGITLSNGHQIEVGKQLPRDTPLVLLVEGAMTDTLTVGDLIESHEELIAVDSVASTSTMAPDPGKRQPASTPQPENPNPDNWW